MRADCLPSPAMAVPRDVSFISDDERDLKLFIASTYTYRQKTAKARDRIPFWPLVLWSFEFNSANFQLFNMKFLGPSFVSGARLNNEYLARAPKTISGTKHKSYSQGDVSSFTWRMKTCQDLHGLSSNITSSVSGVTFVDNDELLLSIIPKWAPKKDSSAR
jgi:hypothetical protein